MTTRTIATGVAQYDEHRSVIVTLNTILEDEYRRTRGCEPLADGRL